MATTIQEPTINASITTPQAAAPPEVEPVTTSDDASGGWSPMAVALGAMAGSIVAVLGLTMAMILVLTDVSVLAAFGFGAYCAFWLGGGFGTILASVLLFGRDH